MAGFEQVLAEKMQNIYPQLVLSAPSDGCFDYKELEKLLHTRYEGKITSTAPAHTKRVILRSKNSSATSVANLKAIDPDAEPRVSSLEKKVRNVSLKNALVDKKIIIGTKLADYHNLSVGDECSLLFCADEQSASDAQSFETVHVTIGGIMDTGIMQYDKFTLICSLAMARKDLSDESITQIGLKLTPDTDDVALAHTLADDLGVECDSWKTLYPALVSVTKLEKYVMFLLLILVTLIASANIIALIFMQITQKKTDIALLKVMGMNHSSVTAIFVFMGTILASCAAFSGLCAALLIGILLEQYPFITLPDAYLCTHLPIYIEWPLVILIFAVIIVISMCASLFAAYSTRYINCSTTLRFEG
jgi:lipoprotein-releasing system permease protein